MGTHGDGVIKPARIVFLAVVCLLCVPWGSAESVKDMAQPTSYVVDLAGVIDPDARAQMEQLAAEVEREAHATIEVVTIHSLDGASIEDFATELEEKWKVGPKGTDRGVILLFAINDHKRRIEVGYGLEGVLNDAKVGDIGRSMVSDLRAGDYGSAILGGERQIADDIAKDAGVTLTPLPGPPQQRGRRTSSSRGPGIFPFLFLIFVLFLVFRGGRGGGGGGGGGFGGGSWLPWFLIGNALGSGRRDRGDGGGGWGGGGGDSGGGGFGGGDDGGFSGGFGGGSGGGGASGDW
jgi:uncharacterized protein